MNKHISISLMTTFLLAQVQIEVCAQSTDRVESQTPPLQPAMSATFDSNLRGPISGQSTAQSSSQLPFTTSSPYSYTEPVNAANSSNGIQPALPAQLPVTGPSTAASAPPSSKQKRHGFSPAGAVLGVPDRAVKSSLGLTDRTAKFGLGVTGKTTKEFFKAIF